jgi:hypothetical protein
LAESPINTLDFAFCVGRELRVVFADPVLIAANDWYGKEDLEISGGFIIYIRALRLIATGALATAGYGTAVGVIRALHSKGRLDRAYCTETRPYNQGR